jgi:hypothetical protein
MKKTGVTIIAALALLAPFAKADVATGPIVAPIVGGGMILLAGIVAVILVISIVAIKVLRWYNARKQSP